MRNFFFIVVVLVVSGIAGYWLGGVFLVGLIVRLTGLDTEGWVARLLQAFLTVGVFFSLVQQLGGLVDRFFPPKESNLVPCPECARQVSRLATTCPQCGRPLQPQKQNETAGSAKRNQPESHAPNSAIDSTARNEPKAGPNGGPTIVEFAIGIAVLAIGAFAVYYFVFRSTSPSAERVFEHTQPVTSLAFSPDGRTILTGSGDAVVDAGVAQLWDLNSGELIGMASTDGPPVGVAFAPDGKGFWVCGAHTLDFWDLERAAALLRKLRTGKPDFPVMANRSLKTATEPFMPSPRNLAFALSPSGNNAIVGFDKGAVRWDFREGTKSFIFDHSAPVISAAWHPNELTILTGSDDKSVRRWGSQLWGPIDRPRFVNAASSFSYLPPHQGRVLAVAFNPNGKTLVSASEDKTARIWDSDGKSVGDALEHPDSVCAVAFRPDGKTILTGCGNFDKGRGEARLWDMATGKLLGKPFPHKSTVTAVAFSPDGKTFATGSEDKTVKLWKVPDVQK